MRAVAKDAAVTDRAPVHALLPRRLWARLPPSCGDGTGPQLPALHDAANVRLLSSEQRLQGMQGHTG
jgi:hypothetical protein